MSLIKVKEIGYGLYGDTLDMTIAIPKGSYLSSLKAYNQKDLKEADCITIPGIDYIKVVAETEGVSEEYAFKNKVFEYIKDCEDELTGNVWEIYKLKPDFEWVVNINTKGIGIKISQEDLTLVSMQLEITLLEDFTPSTECGEDTTVLTVPLYNLLPMRLKTLNSAKFIENTCEVPRNFMNMLLMLRTIELALCCGDYCKAAIYWNKFYSRVDKNLHKKCGCHG